MRANDAPGTRVVQSHKQAILTFGQETDLFLHRYHECFVAGTVPAITVVLAWAVAAVMGIGITTMSTFQFISEPEGCSACL